MSERFDVINFHDIVSGDGDPHAPWKRIGGGSFGVVYRASYLGTQVAVKEVLPNDTYDVAKYFERECVLMKEARHPNIVQYIGLSRSPGADGRIYIISEFVGPNLRGFIADTRKPFPWRLRISFATDIARALAYLHARNCLHRDLKPENLLITDNERIKMCDFGFARIAARNEEEMRRMSYCGTDGYMSPEILMGLDFSLPSDIFSLGVIFAEIASRHLVDATTFKRSIPSFTVDPQEIREMASEGCPDRLVQLAIDCTQENPAHRPDMREVLMRLRLCEQEILAREEAEAEAKQHQRFYSVGSMRGASSLAAVLGSKKGSRLKNTANAAADGHDQPQRPSGPPRLPSFQGQISMKGSLPDIPNESDEDSDDEKAEKEVEEALAALEKVGVPVDPSAPDLGVGVDPFRPTQLVSTIRGHPATSSSFISAGPNEHNRGNAAAAFAYSSPSKNVGGAGATGTFKVSGYGNPWWSDEDGRASLISIPASWVRGVNQAGANTNAKHGFEASSATAREPLLGGAEGEEQQQQQQQYSTSVVRSSFSKISAAHGHDGYYEAQRSMPGSRFSVLTARNGAIPEGDVDEQKGSTITIKQGAGLGKVDSVGRHPNVDISEMPRDGALQSTIVNSQSSGAAGSTVSAMAPGSREGSAIREAPARGGGLRSRLFGRSSDSSSTTPPSPSTPFEEPKEEEPEKDKNSTIKKGGVDTLVSMNPHLTEDEVGPGPLYHRFTLVKNSTRRPVHMSPAQQAAAAAKGISGGPATGSLLPPAVMLSNALARCWFAQPDCQELVFPPAGGEASDGSIGGSGAGVADGSVQYHHHPRAPSVPPVVYQGNSGPRWHHPPIKTRSGSDSASSSSGASSPSTGGGGGGGAGGARKVSSSSSASNTSASTPRSRSRSRSSSSRSNSADVKAQQITSRAAESLAAYAAAAGLMRGGGAKGDHLNGAANRSTDSAKSGNGHAADDSIALVNNGAAMPRFPLGQAAAGTHQNRSLSPPPGQRRSSVDGKIAKLIKGAKRKSSAGSNASSGAGAGAVGVTSPLANGAIA
ncbi:hypothetical protein OC845_002536 [Tilletia horrida]|nr:hypothetical protein OC845_002536 [Tilletia horrida]